MNRRWLRGEKPPPRGQTGRKPKRTFEAPGNPASQGFRGQLSMTAIRLKSMPATTTRAIAIARKIRRYGCAVRLELGWLPRGFVRCVISHRLLARLLVELRRNHRT